MKRKSYEWMLRSRKQKIIASDIPWSTRNFNFICWEMNPTPCPEIKFKGSNLPWFRGIHAISRFIPCQRMVTYWSYVMLLFSFRWSWGSSNSYGRVWNSIRYWIPSRNMHEGDGATNDGPSSNIQKTIRGTSGVTSPFPGSYSGKVKSESESPTRHLAAVLCFLQGHSSRMISRKSVQDQ